MVVLDRKIGGSWRAHGRPGDAGPRPDSGRTSTVRWSRQGRVSNRSPDRSTRKRQGWMTIQTGIDGSGPSRRGRGSRTARMSGRRSEMRVRSPPEATPRARPSRSTTRGWVVRRGDGNSGIGRPQSPGGDDVDQMPHIMIEKVAEALALRRRSPGIRTQEGIGSDLFTTEEMAQAENVPAGPSLLERVEARASEESGPGVLPPVLRGGGGKWTPRRSSGSGRRCTPRLRSLRPVRRGGAGLLARLLGDRTDRMGPRRRRAAARSWQAVDGVPWGGRGGDRGGTPEDPGGDDRRLGGILGSIVRMRMAGHCDPSRRTPGSPSERRGILARVT